MAERYQKSEELLERAFGKIPLGTQTFSKSITQFPKGISPYFIEKGKGSKVWDVDGNEYVDFINSLCAITLGYCDEDVNLAVSEMLQRGSIFSLANKVEIDVSEKITEIIPCAEMVRFGKNGSDATSGAIRAARGFTGRDYVVVCGYHGWQDWYIGSTTRNLGVPKSTKELTLKFEYNNIESLNKLFNDYPDQISCIIMEAMNIAEPKNNFLQEVKELCHKNGALFILDEMITGFRYANGGAQEYFGVTPDLATFGKGIANGFPLSVVTGRADIMKIFEESFFSFTFGGETLSLAAALATMKKYQREPVVKSLKSQGQKLLDGVQKIINDFQSENIFSLAGHPSWSFFIIKDTPEYSNWEIKTLYMQEMLKRGILTFGTHNISYSHSDKYIKKILCAYEEIIPLIKTSIEEKNLLKKFDAEPIKPLFKVR